MKTKIAFIAFAAFSLTVAAQSPQVFLMNAERLASLKNKLSAGDRETTLLVDSLVKKADRLLTMKPVSVMEKAFTPKSGDRHDYMSQAPYFWYDSSKPNGLPYLRRDGKRNPEINRITDKKYLVDLENATKTLALAYYFTGEEKYAAKTTELIRHWFFNENTRMNPNLEHAQAVPGINHGRGIGIIESRSFTGIGDAAGLLQGSKAWTPTDDRSLRQWYAQFLHWMLTSKNGKEERAAKNNHGTWYYVQVIHFALFTGDTKMSKNLAVESLARLDSQLTRDGKQPLELERTKALSYSTMNLRGWFEVATLAEHAGVDIWNYKTSSGSSLRLALDWLLPYALQEKKWNYQQIEKYDSFEIYPVLLQASRKFDSMSYQKKADGIKRFDTMIYLLYQ